VETIPFRKSIDLVPNIELNHVLKDEDHLFPQVRPLCFTAIPFGANGTNDSGEKSVLHAASQILDPHVDPGAEQLLSLFPFNQLNFPGGLLFDKVADGFVQGLGKLQQNGDGKNHLIIFDFMDPGWGDAGNLREPFNREVVLSA
jgi:hypothetical protein